MPLTSYHVVMVVTALLTVIGLGMVLSSSNVLAFSGGGTRSTSSCARPCSSVSRRDRFGGGAADTVEAGQEDRDAGPSCRSGCWSWCCSARSTVRGAGSIFGSSIQPAEIAQARVHRLGLRGGRQADPDRYCLICSSPPWWAICGGRPHRGGARPGYGHGGDARVPVRAVVRRLPDAHFLWVIAFGVVVFGVLAATFAYRFERIRTYIDTVQGDFSNPQGRPTSRIRACSPSPTAGCSAGWASPAPSGSTCPRPPTTSSSRSSARSSGGSAPPSWSPVPHPGLGGYADRRPVGRPFRRLLAGTISATIVLQAFINIGYVVGLLPVTGLQLPLISNGGTSAVVTLTSLGLLANCARHEPEAISAILSSPQRRRRTRFSLPDPQPYTPERPVPASAAPGRSSEGARRYGDPVTRRQPTGPAPRDRAAARRTAQPAPGPRPPRGGPQPPRTRPCRSGRGGRDWRRGATAMTGRTARPVRGREAERRQPDVPRRTPVRAPGTSRPSPIHRGRQR